MDDSIVWAIFAIIVVVLLALDLFVLNRGSKHIDTRRALLETVMWISVALAFGVFIFIEYGADLATEYYTAYVIEKAMSIDNLFVFIMIFGMFAIPDEYQHKALFYGIIGAVVFRALFIVAGVELLNNFHFVMYIFGILLVYAALRTLFKKDDENKENRTAKFLSKHMNCSPELDGDRLFTRIDGKRVMTPLLMCILVIELTDIVFALDSIPAVLAISTDMLIVYTSNIFAVLGLRSLYFAIRGGLESLSYLKYGLGVILLFVAFKLLASDLVHIPVWVSLVIILGVLAVTIIASLMVRGKWKTEVSRR
ncbi:MAG: TerC family protein [Candidatus Methanomethylophilaceae archaeon]